MAGPALNKCRTVIRIIACNSDVVLSHAKGKRGGVGTVFVPVDI